MYHDEFYEIKHIMTIQLLSDLAGISRETTGHIVHEIYYFITIQFLPFFINFFSSFNSCTIWPVVSREIPAKLS
jgi:hypothetical protein